MCYFHKVLGEVSVSIGAWTCYLISLISILSDLNLLDWSCNNHLAVALGGFVYLWNAVSGDIVQLCQTVTPECYIGSVAWIKEGNYIALGDSDGVVQVGVFLIIIS